MISRRSRTLPSLVQFEPLRGVQLGEDAIRAAKASIVGWRPGRAVPHRFSCEPAARTPTCAKMHMPVTFAARATQGADSRTFIAASGDGPCVKRLLNNALYLIGAVVTVAAFIGLIASHSLKSEAKHYSYEIALAAITLFLVACLEANYIATLRQRTALAGTSHEPGSADKPAPTEHDQKLFSQIAATVPQDGEMMAWLKRDFLRKAFLSRRMTQVDQAIAQFDLVTVGFDNELVADAFGGLREALEALVDAVSEYMWLDNAQVWLSVPTDWPEEKIQTAIATISSARDQVIETYDNLLAVAHKNGIELK